MQLSESARRRFYQLAMLDDTIEVPYDSRSTTRLEPLQINNPDRRRIVQFIDDNQHS